MTGNGGMLGHLGPTLRELRERNRARVLELALAAGTDPSTLYRFERGEHWPQDPDRIVAAYALASNLPSRALWRTALERWEQERSEHDRQP